MVRSTLRCGALTFGCVLASAFGSTAGAQLLNHKDLSASIAITIAQTAIETCKANDLDVYRYLVDLFKALPYAKTADDYEALLPWKLGKPVPKPAT